MQEVKSANAPEPVGPYSQAVVKDGLVYLSGQIGLDPATGQLVSDDVLDQAKQVLTNLSEVAKEAGTSLQNTVKAEIFMTNIADFKDVNQIYGEFFNGQPSPARQTIGVASLPLGAKIEISAIIAL